MGSRSSLPPRGSTPSGLVALSLLLCLPSRPCGSPRPSTTRRAPLSSTGSASKCSHILVLVAKQIKEESTLTHPKKKKKNPPPNQKKKKKKKKSTCVDTTA